MYRSLLTAILLLVPVTGSLAQDPLKVAPQAYKLEFENEWVKVMRVHYGPREKIPAHNHTEWAAAYVYLNDAGPVIFKHIGLDYGAITRPETKAGSFRLYKAIKEVHEVENTSDTPSHFLRVEFKTEPVNEKTLRGKFHREPYPAGENYSKVQFENEQVRVSRLVFATEKEIEVVASPAEPTLLVALTPAKLKVARSNGKASEVTLQLGQTHWLSQGEGMKVRNIGEGPVETLQFEFKTKPAAQAKPPDHQHKQE
jgi:hypothetical protein